MRLCACGCQRGVTGLNPLRVFRRECRAALAEVRYKRPAALTPPQPRVPGPEPKATPFVEPRGVIALSLLGGVVWR
jgi:hypothetical protein